MPRARYPSDEIDRRRDPYAKVYLRARSHPRTAEAFADPKLRGILTGLWMLGQAAHAGDRGDELIITRGDLTWITGTSHRHYAEKSLRTLCELVNYRVTTRGELIIVSVENLSENQRGAPKTTAGDSVQLRASEAPKHRSTEAPKHRSTEAKREESAPRSRKRAERSDAPSELTHRDYERVRIHFELVSPGDVAKTLDARIENSLRYYQSVGQQQVDWGATVINNITSRVDAERERKGEPPLRSVKAARELKQRIDQPPLLALVPERE